MKRKKSVQPDEVAQLGPISLAKFGDVIVAKNNISPEVHKEFIDSCAGRLPEIEEEIDELIKEAKRLILKNPPLKLIHTAYQAVVSSNMGVLSESEGAEEANDAVLLLEYIQNVIAAEKPETTNDENFCYVDWVSLGKVFAKLRFTMNNVLPLVSLAKLKKEDQLPDSEMFRQEAVGHWINVRNERYPIHEKINLYDLIKAHSDLIEAKLGVDSETLVREFEKIRVSLSAGIFEAFNGFADLIHNEEIPSDIEVMRDKAMPHFGKMFGYDLFDLELVTDLPVTTLKMLSWELGEEDRFLSPDNEKAGWLTEVTPVLKRPFISIEGKFYCFRAFGLFDRLYRTIERIVKQDKDKQQPWIDIQQENTENLAVEYFEKLLPGCKVIQGVYYPKKGTKKSLCELDAVIIYGDHLFIIEVKAGKFIQCSPYDDFDGHIKSVQQLLKNPAEQGERFLEYLRGADSVKLYDQDRNEIGELKQSDFRVITICPFSVDAFTELASRHARISGLINYEAKSALWPVSLNDIREISEIFKNPLVFLHFIEMRLKANQCENLNLNDELDHVGMYLQHNGYSIHADDIAESLRAESPNLNFGGYRQEIDHYFQKKALGEDVVDLHQELEGLSKKFTDLVSFVSDHNPQDNCLLVSDLLSLGGHERIQLGKGLEQTLERQLEIRNPAFVAFNSDPPCSIACWQSHVFPTNSFVFGKRVLSEMVAKKDPERLKLELFYDSSDRLTDVKWEILRLDDVLPKDRKALEYAGKGILKRRVNNFTEKSGKIGRNDACPCGSGKKYKKCCG